MRTKTIQFVFAIALSCAAIWALLNEAKADDAYLCDDGKIIKVALQDLDWMKRNNACIAAHFGLPSPTAIVPPLPVQRVKFVPKKPKNLQIAAIDPQSSRPAQPKPASSKKRQSAKLVAQPKMVTKPKAVEFPAEKPNYRDVIIINASPGAPRVFHHRF